MTTNQTRGIYLALITALISGISIFVNKFAVAAVGQPLVFTALKNTAVGILVLGVLIGARKIPKLKQLKSKEKIYLLLIGIIGGAIPFYLFFTGITMIPAINAALIHKTLVIWVMILAIPLLKEKVNGLQLLAIALLFSSNLVIGGFKGFLFAQGELLILAATILWAIETVIAKKVLKGVDPDIVVAARMVIGAAILMVAAIFTAPAAFGNILTLSVVQTLFVVATVVFLLGYVMSWYRALKFAPAIVVTSVLVSSTLVTNILSASFITHTWTLQNTYQMILILSGIGLFWLAAKRQDAQLVSPSQ